MENGGVEFMARCLGDPIDLRGWLHSYSRMPCFHPCSDDAAQPNLVEKSLLMNERPDGVESEVGVNAGKNLKVMMPALCMAAALCGLLAGDPARAGSNVLQADDFNDNSVNAAIWTLFTSPPKGGGYIEESGNAILLRNRAHLRANVQPDPTAASLGGLHLSGTWKFNQGTASIPEFMQIMTRSSGIYGGGTGETSFGLEFRIYMHERQPIIVDRGGLFSITNLRTGSVTANTAGDTLAFDIWDFGDGKAAVVVTKVAGAVTNAGQWAGSLAAVEVTNTPANNYVCYHGREFTAGTKSSILDDAVIAAPSSWSGAGEAGWAGTSWTGGSGATTNPSGIGAAVIFGKSGTAGTVRLDADSTVGAMAFYPDVNTSISASNGCALTLDSRASASEPFGNAAPWAGIMVLGGAHAISPAVVLRSSAVFSILASGSQLTVAGGISEGIPGRGVVKGGEGTLVLAGTNTYTGGTIVSLGAVDVRAVNALPVSGPVMLCNAAGVGLNLNGNSQTIGALSGGGAAGGNVDLGGALLTVGDSASTTYAGVISGARAGSRLTKAGSGTLVLTGASAYSGDTVIAEGTLGIAQPFLCDMADVYIRGAGSLSLNFQGEDMIGRLFCNGVQQPRGVYGPGDLEGRLAGTGFLRVVRDPSDGIVLLVR